MKAFGMIEVYSFTTAVVAADNTVQNLSGTQLLDPFRYGNDFTSRGENAGNRHNVKRSNFGVAQGFFKTCEFFFVSADSFGKEYFFRYKGFVHFYFSNN